MKIVKFFLASNRARLETNFAIDNLTFHRITYTITLYAIYIPTGPESIKKEMPQAVSTKKEAYS